MPENINSIENSYQRNIQVHTSQQNAFEAIMFKLGLWWGNIDQAPEKIGDVFKISFGGESYWKFEIIELAKPNHIVWKCVASNQDHNLKGIDEEWLGTTIHWSLFPFQDQTKIHFIHDGLVPDAVCYEVCSAGWDFYIVESLQGYLNNGQGKPWRE